MITQQQLIDKCTPEIIKKMVELAEGFDFTIDYNKELYIVACGEKIFCKDLFTKRYVYFLSSLIHRAVEGWNKKDEYSEVVLDSECITYKIIHKKSLYVEDKEVYFYDDYQSTALTHAECAILHCLIEVPR